MKCDSHPSNFENEIVKKARILIIDKITTISWMVSRSWIPILRNLTNRHLYLKQQSRNESHVDYVDFISSWLENERPVGTSWTGIMREETVKRVLINLKMRPEVVAVSDNYVELRVNSSSSLQFFYKALQPLDFYSK